MRSSRVTQVSIAVFVVLGLALSGCGVKAPAGGWRADEPVAPLYAEPSLVRVLKGSISLNSLSDPLAPTKEVKPGQGMRFIIVGFPIGEPKPLAVDDYYVLDGHPDGTYPRGAWSEDAEPTALFYDADEMANPLNFSKGKEEINGLDDKQVLVTWQTPHSTLVLVFEVSADQKTVTLHHGKHSFQLEPDTGKIDGKGPAK